MIFRKPAYLLLVFLCFGIENGSAQQEDFQLRTGIAITKELPFNLDGSFEIQQRFKENIMQYDRSLATFGLGYGIVKGLKVSVGYRFVNLKTDELEYAQKYRLNADLRYKREISGFDVKIRTRIQYGYDEGWISTDYSDQKLVSRNLLGVSYKIIRTRFAPYLNYELFTHLNDEEGVNFYQTRLNTGCVIKLTSNSELDAYYMLENEFNVVDPWRAHIIGLSYQYDF